MNGECAHLVGYSHANKAGSLLFGHCARRGPRTVAFCAGLELTVMAFGHNEMPNRYY